MLSCGGQRLTGGGNMASGSRVLRRLLHLSAGNCLLLLLLLLLFLCGQLGGGQKKKEVEPLLLSPSRPAEGPGLPRRASSTRRCPGEGLRPPAPRLRSPPAPRGRLQGAGQRLALAPRTWPAAGLSLRRHGRTGGLSRSRRKLNRVLRCHLSAPG